LWRNAQLNKRSGLLKVVDRFYQGFVCSTGSSGPDVGQTPVTCYAAAAYRFARVRVEPALEC